MIKKIDISDFSPQTDILKIKGTEKHKELKLYREKYVKLVLSIVDLKNEIYGELDYIEYHELDDLNRIILDKGYNQNINEIIFKIVDNLKKHIEKAKYVMENEIPENFIKYHFKKNIELEGKVKLECLHGAIIIEFEKNKDFFNYTGYEENTSGLYYYYSNVIAINGFKNDITKNHELQHFKAHEIFNYFGKHELENLIKHQSVTDEFLARSVKMNFGEIELKRDILAKNTIYFKGKNTDYEISNGKKNYTLLKKLEQKYGKDFIKIANITTGKRLEWFL